MTSHRSQPEDAPGAAPAGEPAAEATAPGQESHSAARVPARPPRTRVGAAFSGFTIGAVLLLLLLIFILENTASVKISFLGAGGHVALGVALLLSAVGGALVVALIGVARIAQVRRHATRRIRER
jgi:uncharacterized integral membrane protein